MKFTCNKHMWYIWAIAFLLLSPMCAWVFIREGIMYDIKWAIYAGVLASAYCLWLAVAGAIYYGKQIHMDAKGCTISFLFIKQFYPWEFYETKRYQKAKHRNPTRINEGEYVVVFCRKAHYTDLARPTTYCMHFSPLMSFCLGTYPEGKDQIRMFTLDDTTIPTLTQWGVQIENLPNGSGNDVTF